MSRTKILTPQPLSQNIFTLRRPGVANFADIIRIETIFVTRTFKNSKKVKRIGSSLLELNLYLHFFL